MSSLGQLRDADRGTLLRLYRKLLEVTGQPNRHRPVITWATRRQSGSGAHRAQMLLNLLGDGCGAVRATELRWPKCPFPKSPVHRIL